MANTELQFEMAMRDQVIHNQRKALNDFWNLLMGIGFDERQVVEFAAKQGLMIEDWKTSCLHLSCQKLSPNLACSRYPPIRCYSPCEGQYTRSSFIIPHNEDPCLGSLCREDINSFVTPHSSSAPSGLELKSFDHSVRHGPGSWLGDRDMNPKDLRRHSCPNVGIRPHHGKSCIPLSSLSVDFGRLCKVWTLHQLF